MPEIPKRETPKREISEYEFDYGREFLTIDDENCIELNTFWKNENKFDNPYVTHWMPLPEPPKEA